MTVIVVALVGVAVNAVTAIMFASGRKGDLNIRGPAAMPMPRTRWSPSAWRCRAALFLVTGWTWIDPAVSLIIGGFIVLGAWSLMRESLDLALQAVPSGVDRAGVLKYLRALPGVEEVHDLHIWGMSTTETALTAHLVRPGGDVDDNMLHGACAELRASFRIDHATLQVESGGGRPCELAAEEVV